MQQRGDTTTTPSTISTARPDPSAISVSLRVNGTSHDLALDPRTSLLDLLRDGLQLTGTKKGCNQGACGACTVLVDGERMLSCLTLGVQCDGHEVTTIEAIGATDLGRSLQVAFIDHDGFQCGYCTPGQICSAIGMLDELRRGVPSAVTGSTIESVELHEDELKERMSGNLCRCGAYVGIREAIQAAHEHEKGARQ
jgi:xanthine dehydrogenase YagT iron-sulfur-binding subunit